VRWRPAWAIQRDIISKKKKKRKKRKGKTNIVEPSL
jgi:hypothetical protein